MAVLPIGPDGRLKPASSVRAHEGSGPNHGPAGEAARSRHLPRCRRALRLLARPRGRPGLRVPLRRREGHARAPRGGAARPGLGPAPPGVPPGRDAPLRDQRAPLDRHRLLLRRGQGRARAAPDGRAPCPRASPGRARRPRSRSRPTAASSTGRTAATTAWPSSASTRRPGRLDAGGARARRRQDAAALRDRPDRPLHPRRPPGLGDDRGPPPRPRDRDARPSTGSPVEGGQAGLPAAGRRRAEGRACPPPSTRSSSGASPPPSSSAPSSGSSARGARRSPGNVGIGGLRTFILFSLIGAVGRLALAGPRQRVGLRGRGGRGRRARGGRLRRAGPGEAERDRAHHGDGGGRRVPARRGLHRGLRRGRRSRSASPSPPSSPTRSRCTGSWRSSAPTTSRPG